MKCKILIISKDQFGYLTDSYKYCMYMSDKYDITYLCIDWGLEKKYNDKIKIVYIENKKGYLNKFSYLLKETYKLCKENKYDKIFCIYFRLCAILSFFIPKNKLILDIRTGNVSKNKVKRNISDIELLLNSYFFKNKTIISTGLATKLRIKNYNLLPLGADIMINEDYKIYNKMNLLYIGTLENRNIADTLIGYKKYLYKTNSYEESTYTIIGHGSIEEENLLINTIIKEGLQKNVFFLGRKEHSELENYLRNSTVGISYIPMTPYFMNQPPTKTYEYIMNGLICLGTNTTANKEIINSTNGVLCEDNPEDFCRGLMNIKDRLDIYNIKKMQKTVENNSWELIVKNYLEPVLEDKKNKN